MQTAKKEQGRCLAANFQEVQAWSLSQVKHGVTLHHQDDNTSEEDKPPRSTGKERARRGAHP